MKFSKSHEYLKDDGTIGISQYAAEQLGDVTFVELPAAGKFFAQGEEFGVVESVKTASSLYAPVSGTVQAINGELQEHPEYVNEDPYGKGWLLKVAVADPAEAAALLDEATYQSEFAVH